MKIGFIGTGVIATAMVQGIVHDGHDIFVTERSRANSTRLATMYANVTVADSQTVVDQSETVIVCLLADTARTVLPTLTFRPDQRVYSVMVDIYLAELAQLVDPAAAEGIFIPYPHIAQGGSPLLVYPSSETLEAIFGSRNTLIPLPDESLLNSYLAAQAVLLPTVKLLHETSLWLAERVGDTETAERFVRILVGSYLMGVDDEQTGVLPTLVDALGTEGGLNAQLRDHFTTQGVYPILHDGLNQLETRLQ
ncbi:MAG: NAD(P)-binding domain-containing protein [Ardenticatenaceae bacterium]